MILNSISNHTFSGCVYEAILSSLGSDRENRGENFAAGRLSGDTGADSRPPSELVSSRSCCGVHAAC